MVPSPTTRTTSMNDTLSTIDTNWLDTVKGAAGTVARSTSGNDALMSSLSSITNTLGQLNNNNNNQGFNNPTTMMLFAMLASQRNNSSTTVVYGGRGGWGYRATW